MPRFSPSVFGSSYVLDDQQQFISGNDNRYLYVVDDAGTGIKAGMFQDGVFVPEPGFALSDGPYSHMQSVTLTKTGGGFGVKPNDPRPILWWDADDESLLPSALGRKTAWDSDFSEMQKSSAIVAPGSSYSYRFDHGTQPGESMAIVDFPVSNTTTFYVFSKRYDDFVAVDQVAIRTRFNGANSDPSLGVGDTITGATSGITAEIEDLFDNGTTGSIFYVPDSGTLTKAARFQHGETITNGQGWSGLVDEIGGNYPPESSRGTLWTLNYKQARYYRFTASSNNFVSMNPNDGDFTGYNVTYAGGTPVAAHSNGQMARPELMEHRSKEWCHHEWRYRMNSVLNAITGDMDYRQDSRRAMEIPAFSQRTTATPEYLEKIVAVEISNGARAGTWNYYSCYYVDDSWCRVFLSDEPTYQDAVTDLERYTREICIPSSWSDGAITFALRIGSLLSLG